MHAGLGKLGAVPNRALRVGLSDEQNLKGMRALAMEMPGLAEKPCSPCESSACPRAVGGGRRLGLRGSCALDCQDVGLD